MPGKHDLDQARASEDVDQAFAPKAYQPNPDDLPYYLRELADHLEHKAEWLMADAATYRKAADAVAANNARVAVYKFEAAELRAKLAALT